MSEISAEFIACLVNVLDAFKRGEWDTAELSADRFSDENEITLVELLREVQMSIMDVTALARDIAKGDYSTVVAPLSGRDKLGQALFDMTATLHDVADAARKVSDGDFSAHVPVKGDNDLLAVAINRTVEQLREAEIRSRRHNEELERANTELISKSATLVVKNTELEDTSRQLQQKAREVEIASRYKSEFLANMSHELRTPLNSVIALAKLLEENTSDNMTEKQVDFAGTIRSAGQDLLTIINDILDLSKVEAGKMNFFIEAVQADALVDEVLRQMAPLIEEKGLKLATRFDAVARETVLTDSHRVGQILKNLLSNALKFTTEGGIDVRVFRPENPAFKNGYKPAGEMHLAVAVQDTGVGIKAEQFNAVFGEFLQGDGGINRSYGGTGLGLTISRKLARKLGGDLQVESEAGSGSTFTLYLPSEIPSDGSRAYRSASAVAESVVKTEMPQVQSLLVDEGDYDDLDTEALAGKSVLFIARDMRSVFTLLSLSEKLRIDLVHARTCLDAMDVLAEERVIDLVLIQSDERCRNEGCICSSRELHRVPTIVITEEGKSEVRAAYHGKGVDFVFDRPTGIRDLLIQVNRLLGPVSRLYSE